MATITERRTENGKRHYQVKIRLKGYPPQAATFRRKKEAERWAQATEAALRERRYFKAAESGRRTVGEVIERYIREILPTKRSARSQRAQLLWWHRELGHLTLADLTPATIADCRDRLARGQTPSRKKASPASQVRYLAALSHVFTVAVREWGWLDDNPVRNGRKKPGPRRRGLGLKRPPTFFRLKPSRSGPPTTLWPARTSSRVTPRPPSSPGRASAAHGRIAGMPAIETFVQDLKHSLRMFARSPAFTVAAIAALTLGIGVNTAIFSVVNVVLLRPMAVPDPDRLVMFMNVTQGGPVSAASPAKFQHYRRQTGVVQDVAAFTTGVVNYTGGSFPEQLASGRVSADFFRLFGAAPILGRTFSPEEDRPGGGRVAILSERLWTSRFGSDPGVIGRAISLNGEPYTVIGVLGPFHFDIGANPQVWTPFQLDPNAADQGITSCARAG
jgi:hypothetical protein